MLIRSWKTSKVSKHVIWSIFNDHVLLVHGIFWQLQSLLLHDITNNFLGIVRLKIEVCFISLPLNVQLRLTVVGTDLPEVVERNIFGGMLVEHTFDKE